MPDTWLFSNHVKYPFIYVICWCIMCLDPVERHYWHRELQSSQITVKCITVAVRFPTGPGVLIHDRVCAVIPWGVCVAVEDTQSSDFFYYSASSFHYLTLDLSRPRGGGGVVIRGEPRAAFAALPLLSLSTLSFPFSLISFGFVDFLDL